MIALELSTMRAITLGFYRCMLIFQVGKDEDWKLWRDKNFVVGRCLCGVMAVFHRMKYCL